MTPMTAKTDQQPARAPVVVPSDAADAPDLRPEVVVDQVFLSPRVVDRRAFSELATELRGIVEQAAAERRGVAAILEQAGTATRTLKEHESAQHANLALAAKAVKGIDERLARAQALVDEAHKAAQAIDTLGVKADRLVIAKIEALEARAEAAQAAASARAEALEERLRSAAREFEQRLDAMRRDADQLLGPSRIALETQMQRAAALLGRGVDEAPGSAPAPGSLSDVVARAGALHAGAESALSRLAEVQGIATQSRDAMGGLLDDLASVMGRVDAQRETLAAEADRVREACKQAGAVIDQRLIDVQRAASIAAEDAREAGRRAFDDLAPRLDEETSSGRQRLAEASARAIESIDQQRANFDAAAQDTMQRMERTCEQSLSNATLAAERSGEAAARTEAAAGALGTLLAQVNDAQNTASLTMRLVERSIGQMNTAIAALEPWQGLLRADGQPPEPIRRIVDSVRQELRGDLGAIAEALRGALAGAERAGASLGTQQVRAPASLTTLTPLATRLPGERAIEATLLAGTPAPPQAV